jgi:glycosyltransferase involved in cell wall biosynthesis
MNLVAPSTHRRKIGINLLCFSSAQFAGTGHYIKALLEAMPASGDAEFVFFCQRGFDFASSFQLPPDLRFHLSHCPSFSSPLMRIAYEQFFLPFKAKGLDALFSPCVANPIFHPGFPTITTIHDITPFVVKRKYGFIQQFYVRWITRILAHSSTRLVTVSENSRSDLIHHLGIPKDKIDVIYNTVRVHHRETIRYENYFLYVGTIQPAKNLETALRAFSIFSKKYDRSGHRFIVVGARGWGQTSFPSLIRNLALDEIVEFAGFVSDDELDALYAGCKGVILLSFYEGFGRPPLEALGWRKPSVVSNNSSLPEVVGETGIRVDPLDAEAAAWAIKCIAENPQDYLRGWDLQVAKFSPQREAEKLLSTLKVC